MAESDRIHMNLFRFRVFVKRSPIRSKLAPRHKKMLPSFHCANDHEAVGGRSVAAKCGFWVAPWRRRCYGGVSDKLRGFVANGAQACGQQP